MQIPKVEKAVTKAFVNSLPKSGTNAVQSILVRMPGLQEQRGLGLNRSIRHHPINLLPLGGRRVKVGVKSPVNARLLSVRFSLALLRQGRFTLGHVPYSVEVERLLLARNIRPIIAIRNPRDVILSSVHYAVDNPDHFLNASISQRTNTYDRLLSFVEGGLTDEGQRYLGIGEQIESILGWVESPNCLTVRFEHIIGPRGNGDAELQTQSILAIAEWLDIRLSEAQARTIGKDMFGKGRTFRSGQSAGWKSEFNDEVNACLQETAGDWIARLGY